MEGLASLIIGVCVIENDDGEAKYTRQGIVQIINHRIGLHVYSACIDKLVKHEAVAIALKVRRGCFGLNSSFIIRRHILLFQIVAFNAYIMLEQLFLITFY